MVNGSNKSMCQTLKVKSCGKKDKNQLTFRIKCVRHQRLQSAIGQHDREKGYRGGANEANWRLGKERVKGQGNWMKRSVSVAKEAIGTLLKENW